MHPRSIKRNLMIQDWRNQYQIYELDANKVLFVTLEPRNLGAQKCLFGGIKIAMAQEGVSFSEGVQ